MKLHFTYIISCNSIRTFHFNSRIIMNRIVLIFQFVINNRPKDLLFYLKIRILQKYLVHLLIL
jgi:hypothetical protein